MDILWEYWVKSRIGTETATLFLALPPDTSGTRDIAYPRTIRPETAGIADSSLD
jgi:hypothetical protein